MEKFYATFVHFYSIKKNQWFARNIRIDLELNNGKVYKRVLQLWVSRKLINSGLDKFYQKKYWCIIFGGNNLKISIWINEKFNAIGEIYLFTTSFFFKTIILKLFILQISILVISSSAYITCLWYVITNSESTNPWMFFTKFFLFSFKTR